MLGVHVGLRFRVQGETVTDPEARKRQENSYDVNPDAEPG